MKTPAAVALVAVIVAAAHGSVVPRRLERQPLELLGLNMVKVEKVIYTLEADKKTTDVTLCINSTIADVTATVVIIDKDQQTDVPGKQTAEDNKCYLFTNVNLPKDKDLVKYELNIHKEGGYFGPLGNLQFPFNDVPKISSFDCNGQEYSRIIYQSANSGAGQICLKSELSNICYLNGNFNVSSAGKGSICLPSQNQLDKEDMVYCQPGSINTVEMGPHESQYLSYNGFYHFSEDNKTTTGPTEALLIDGQKLVAVTAQDNNEVIIDGFKPSSSAYHVCSVHLDKAGGSIQAAYQSKVQDLNVHGQVGNGLCFISFLNDNAKMAYSLTGGTAPVSVGCNRVKAGLPCFSQTQCTGKTVLDLEYAPGGDVNIIKVPQDKITAQ